MNEKLIIKHLETATNHLAAAIRLVKQPAPVNTKPAPKPAPKPVLKPTPIPVSSAFKVRPVDHNGYVTWSKSDNTDAWNAEKANCRQISNKHMMAVKGIAQYIYNKTGRMMIIEDLNNMTGQCQNHPFRTHIGKHIDVLYYDDPKTDWALIFLFLLVFPKGRMFVSVDRFNQFKKIAPVAQFRKIANQLNADAIPRWQHGKHGHFCFYEGLMTNDVDWRAIS